MSRCHAFLDAEEAERVATAQSLFHARLVSCHGVERAAAIIAGQDTAANADLAAWRKLGRGEA